MRAKKRPAHVEFVLCILLLVVGCGYGEVGPVTYQYAQALYSICNLQEETKLASVEAEVNQLKEEGKLSKQEATWLLDIVQDGKEGEWEAAMQKARRIMEDQVK